MNRIKELESLIQENTKTYSQGTSKVSDLEFDLWVEELENLSPNSPYLQIIEEEIGGDYEKVTLPFRSYSQKKTKTLKDLENWIETSKSRLNDPDTILTFCISPKYDGIYIEDFKNKRFTRGKDGIIGQDVSSRANKMKAFISSTNSDCPFGGELITSKKNFEEYFRNAEYTSPRNLIPSLFSNEKLPANLDKIDYIRYNICDSDLNKDIQIDSCNNVNSVKVPYITLLDNELTEDIFDAFFEKWSQEYYIDGLVIDINESNLGFIAPARKTYPSVPI